MHGYLAGAGTLLFALSPQFLWAGLGRLLIRRINPTIPFRNGFRPDQHGSDYGADPASTQFFCCNHACKSGYSLFQYMVMIFNENRFDQKRSQLHPWFGG